MHQSTYPRRKSDPFRQSLDGALVLPPAIDLRLQPRLEELVEFLRRHLAARRALLILLATCTVEYEGRSASHLGKGDRLIIIKPDGAILVHRPWGYSPVNWQPDSKILEVFTETQPEHEEVVVIKSVRARPREVLLVKISKAYLVVAAQGLEDSAEFVEYLDEHQIRDILATHPEEIEPGLRIVRIEKPIEPGFIDLYGVDRQGNNVIIEIKRVTASTSAVKQLKEYVDAFKAKNPHIRVRGILIAPSISKEALLLLNRYGLEYKQINIEKLYRKYFSLEKRSTQKRISILNFIGKVASNSH